MPSTEDLLQSAWTALRAEPRVEAQHQQLKLSLEDGTLTIEGEVADIRAKKLALRQIAAVDGVAWVVDRLRVHAAAPMGDDEIRNHVRDALLLEPALAESTLFVESDGERELVRMPPNRRGEVCISVEGGVVTLRALRSHARRGETRDGELPSRAHKRLAVLLAWWIPGTRDVIDGLGVVPYERDNDDEITDSVRTALEKDPLVDATQLRVHTRNAHVTLLGLVPSESEREAAELDAWFTLGVAGVDNRIEVRP